MMRVIGIALVIWVALTTAILGLLTVFGGPAEAQGAPPNCTDRDVLIERLADGWGEGRVTIALIANGSVLETFANLETGTWTAVVTAPGGPACVVAVGSNFQLTIEPAVAGEES